MQVYQVIADGSRVVSEGHNVPELSCLAESWFIKNNADEVKVINKRSRIVVTDYSDKEKPFKCEWRKAK